MNPTEFAQKIKTKYPQYQGMDDLELTKKIIQKYPTYASQVKLDENKPFRFDIPETREEKINRFKTEDAKLKTESDKANSVGGFLKNAAVALRETIAPSESGLGRTLAAIGNTGTTEMNVESLNKLEGAQVALLKEIRAKEAKGEDVSTLKKTFNTQADQVDEIKKNIQQDTESLNKTNLQVAGEIGGTALDLLTLGTYGKAAQGMKSFALGKSTPSIVAGAREAAGLFTKTGAKKVATGAGVGYAYDVTRGLSGARGEDRMGEKALIPGAGTVAGAVAPALMGANQSIKNLRAKSAETAGKQVDELVGAIAQGKKADITKVKRALSDVDMSSVKTFDDGVQVLNEKIDDVSTKLDDVLDTNKVTKTLDDLGVPMKVGEQTITHNYVDDALNQLDDFYTKTNDQTGKALLAQVKEKALKEGLTIKEVNGIARLHGQKLNAFNANGQAASGLTKQAAENTRKGLKGTARQLFGNDVFKAADEEVSALIRTRDLFAKMSEKVNELRQKVQPRGLGERVGRMVGKTVNAIGLGGPKGLVESFLSRGTGLKTLNALDLEKNLSKNLSLLEKALEKGLPEETVVQRLQAIIDANTGGLNAVNEFGKGKTIFKSKGFDQAQKIIK